MTITKIIINNKILTGEATIARKESSNVVLYSLRFIKFATNIKNKINSFLK